MHLFAPPPITSPLVLATAAPSQTQTTPPLSPETPQPAPTPDAAPETSQRRRIFLPLPPPPFKYRVKVGALFPSDRDTRRETGSTHLRFEADAFPVRVQRGYFRGSAFFVTLGYSLDTQSSGRSLRIASASVSQLVTLPGRPTGPQGRRLPSRTSIGGSYGLYLLSISRGDSGEGDNGSGTNGHFGADLYADYLVGKDVFVEAKYHTLFGGVKGYFGSGPSLLIGRRF